MHCRYRDGECLSAEDEKEIIEKILHYHPHSEDKIGCGLSFIVVYMNLLTLQLYIFQHCCPHRVTLNS